jgi:hypothetical protein
MTTPNTRTTLDVLNSELSMLKDNYASAIRSATDLLERDGGVDRVSTHLGHNLASRAAELSVLAGKIDSVNRVIAHIRATEALAGL